MTKDEIKNIIDERLNELKINKIPEQITALRLEIIQNKDELQNDINETRIDIEKLRGEIQGIKGTINILAKQGFAILAFILTASVAILVKYLFF